MRKLLICAVCVLVSLSARAGFIDGIRISGYDKPFIVTIDNKEAFFRAIDKLTFLCAFKDY